MGLLAVFCFGSAAVVFERDAPCRSTAPGPLAHRHMWQHLIDQKGRAFGLAETSWASKCQAVVVDGQDNSDGTVPGSARRRHWRPRRSPPPDGREGSAAMPSNVWAEGSAWPSVALTRGD
jgi:hypothetical protein